MRANSQEQTSETPFVSIIIPTLNRVSLLYTVVSQIVLQTYRNFDVWIVDQSDDLSANTNEFNFTSFCDPR